VKNKIITIGKTKQSSKKGKFNEARGVIIHNNKIFICDSENKRISVFTLKKGEFLMDFSIAYGKPWGIKAYDNTLYVSTSSPRQLCCYSLEGELQKACFLACDPSSFYVTSDFIYLCEYGSTHRIEILDTKTLQSIKTFGENKFDYAEDIVLYNDLLYISDYRHHVIQIWTKDGEYVKTWGHFGKQRGELNGPMGLACSGSQLFIVDHDNLCIQIFE